MTTTESDFDLETLCDNAYERDVETILRDLNEGGTLVVFPADESAYVYKPGVGSINVKYWRANKLIESGRVYPVGKHSYGPMRSAELGAA